MLTILIFCILILPKITASCPEGSLQWPIDQNQNGSCYFFENNSSAFSAAEVFCAQKGGHLTSIHDAFLNSILAQEAETRFHESTVTDFWIGLTNLMPGGNWTWTDGTPTNFIDWDYGEPKNITGNNCVSLSITDGFWKSDNCFNSKPFVCKIDSIIFQITSTTPKITTTTMAPTTTTTPKKECPFLWIYFEPTNACYGDPFYAGPMNWTLGEQKCQSVGTHLASIHSMEERKFLETLHYMAYDGLWTGAFSNDGGLTWKWSDESSWNFNPWYANPGKGTSACGEIWGGGLQDHSCDKKYRIVCKLYL